jgi:hypothetical protein
MCAPLMQDLRKLIYIFNHVRGCYWSNQVYVHHSTMRRYGQQVLLHTALDTYLTELLSSGSQRRRFKT